MIKAQVEQHPTGDMSRFEGKQFPTGREPIFLTSPTRRFADQTPGSGIAPSETLLQIHSTPLVDTISAFEFGKSTTLLGKEFQPQPGDSEIRHHAITRPEPNFDFGSVKLGGKADVFATVDDQGHITTTETHRPGFPVVRTRYLWSEVQHGDQVILMGRDEFSVGADGTEFPLISIRVNETTNQPEVVSNFGINFVPGQQMTRPAEIGYRILNPLSVGDMASFSQYCERVTGLPITADNLQTLAESVQRPDSFAVQLDNGRRAIIGYSSENHTRVITVAPDGFIDSIQYIQNDNPVASNVLLIDNRYRHDGYGFMTRSYRVTRTSEQPESQLAFIRHIKYEPPLTVTSTKGNTYQLYPWQIDRYAPTPDQSFTVISDDAIDNLDIENGELFTKATTTCNAESIPTRTALWGLAGDIIDDPDHPGQKVAFLPPVFDFFPVAPVNVDSDNANNTTYKLSTIVF